MSNLELTKIESIMLITHIFVVIAIVIIIIVRGNRIDK